MIKLVYNQSEIFEYIDIKDLQGLKILSLLNCYGCNYDFCKFYLVKNKCDYSFMVILDNNCIVYNKSKENVEEIIEFIILNKDITNVNLMIDDKILLNQNILLNFNLSTGNIMKNENKKTDFVVQNQFSNYISITECYNILSLCFDEFEEKVFPGWLCDISHRVRHNQAEVYGIKNIVTAILLYKNNYSGIISQLCVNPIYQKMGYGKDILNYILQHNKDKKIYVYSKNKSIDEFYKINNFDYYGKWLQLKRKRTVL